MRALLWAAVTAMALLAFAPGASAAGTTRTPLATAGSDAEETTFGDLTTDALCSAAGATIAVAPAMTFSEGVIPSGPVKLDAVRKLLHEPEEKWAVLGLTGAQLRATLERAVSFAPTARAFFLQVSGLTVVFDPDAPRGHKVKSISVGPESLNDAASYEVAMPEGLAAGGLGYFTIFGNAPTVRSGTEGLAQLITRYVETQGSVSYTGQGRLVIGR